MSLTEGLAGRRTPTKEEKAAAPHTRVRSGGKVSRRLEILAEIYLKTRPEKAVAWVYSPLHKPELSNVISRQIDGYVMTYVHELGEDTVALLPGMDSDEPIRVGDVIMMAIAAVTMKEIREDLDQAAIGERDRIEEEYYHATDEVTIGKGMRDAYKVRPMGDAVTEEVEVEVEGPESHKET